MTMSPRTARILANGVEYDLIHIRARISDLARRLADVAHEIPTAGNAFRKLCVMRRDLRKMLAALDEPVNAAVKHLETVDAPPF
jgi:hypothetical protein